MFVVSSRSSLRQTSTAVSPDSLPRNTHGNSSSVFRGLPIQVPVSTSREPSQTKILYLKSNKSSVLGRGLLGKTDGARRIR